MTIADAIRNDASLADGDKIEMLALDAQAALLPYALVLSAFALPLFVWKAAAAPNPLWLTAVLIQFAVNWGAFYCVTAWSRRRPDLLADIGARTRLHVFGGLLWAAAVAQLSAFALGAGPAREPLLMLAAGAAVICMFFSSPSLQSLLVVGPAAAIPPLVGLWLTPLARFSGSTAWGGLALAMALSLIMNQLLRRQFRMSVEREQLVEQREIALAKAERLARSKSDLLATLSHEIRNGLTGVNHVLASASGGQGRTAPSREQIASALTAADDLLEVLNSTLDSENAQHGRLAVDCRAFDACRLSRSLALLARPEAAAKNLELTLHIDKALETLLDAAPGAAVADPARVRQILSNLLGNALKYTVRGRVEVRVQRHDSGRLRIEVADTGPGLNAEELDLAFQPFRRVGRTSSGVSGAGLGLSLSRDLARMMGGEVSAESAPGVGSRFWLDLPFDPAARLVIDQEEDDAERGHSLRILLADSDALNAAMLRAMLEQLGHQVAQTPDGGRAQELARLCPFDLAIISAGAGGAGTIAALRAQTGPAAELPMVAVTDGDGAEGQACLAAGADAVLRKPVAVSAVARALAAATEARAETRLVHAMQAAG